MKRLWLILVVILCGNYASAGMDACEELLRAQAAANLGLDLANVHVLLLSEPKLERSPDSYDFRFAAIPRGRVVVTARAPGAKTVSFTIEVQVWDQVPVAQARIDRGALLDSSLFSFISRDVTRCRPVFGKALSTLRARRSIAAGAVLVTGSVEPVPLIDRGGSVTVIAHAGTVTVTRAGTALADASLGETLRVRLNNRKIIRATATGPESCTAGS